MDNVENRSRSKTFLALYIKGEGRVGNKEDEMEPLCFNAINCYSRDSIIQFKNPVISQHFNKIIID